MNTFMKTTALKKHPNKNPRPYQGGIRWASLRRDVFQSLGALR